MRASIAVIYLKSLIIITTSRSQCLLLYLKNIRLSEIKYKKNRVSPGNDTSYIGKKEHFRELFYKVSIKIFLEKKVLFYFIKYVSFRKKKHWEPVKNRIYMLGAILNFHPGPDSILLGSYSKIIIVMV